MNGSKEETQKPAMRRTGGSMQASVGHVHGVLPAMVRTFA